MFTNWGRIGGYDQGQYQNTPYGTAEQAVEEFEKIFKAKSGNEWSERANFEVKPKKYRLVNVNHLQRVKKDKIKFDLETEVPSKLPETVQVIDSLKFCIPHVCVQHYFYISGHARGCC